MNAGSLSATRRFRVSCTGKVCAGEPTSGPRRRARWPPTLLVGPITLFEEDTCALSVDRGNKDRYSLGTDKGSAILIVDLVSDRVPVARQQLRIDFPLAGGWTVELRGVFNGRILK